MFGILGMEGLGVIGDEPSVIDVFSWLVQRRNRRRRKTMMIWRMILKLIGVEVFGIFIGTLRKDRLIIKHRDGSIEKLIHEDILRRVGSTDHGGSCRCSCGCRRGEDDFLRVSRRRVQLCFC